MFVHKVRRLIDLHVLMFLNVLLGRVMMLFVMHYFEKKDFSWHFDRTTGILGCLRWEVDRLPCVLISSFVFNIFGLVGYIRCMEYFDPIVIAVATLMEPVVAELIGFLVGSEALPGRMGWIGNVLVVIGTFCVVAPRSPGPT